MEQALNLSLGTHWHVVVTWYRYRAPGKFIPINVSAAACGRLCMYGIFSVIFWGRLLGDQWPLVLNLGERPAVALSLNAAEKKEKAAGRKNSHLEKREQTKL